MFDDDDDDDDDDDIIIIPRLIPQQIREKQPRHEGQNCSLVQTSAIGKTLRFFVAIFSTATDRGSQLRRLLRGEEGKCLGVHSGGT